MWHINFARGNAALVSTLSRAILDDYEVNSSVAFGSRATRSIFNINFSTTEKFLILTICLCYLHPSYVEGDSIFIARRNDFRPALGSSGNSDWI